jgi:hypothetical protein
VTLIDDKAKVSACVPASAEQLRNLSAALSSKCPVSLEFIGSSGWNSACIQ